jgi:ribosomal protein S18 acetylase RimI-like enzyme
MSKQVRFENSNPTSEQYNYLRKEVGWPTYGSDVVEKALSKTFFSVCVFDEGTIVGMGRVIGDDAIYFHIQDVIIHPSWQGQGIGKLIVEQLLKYIESKSVSSSNVGLMCSKGREAFYQKFGFTSRPSEKFGAGMIKIIE